MEHRWGKRSSVDVPVTLHLGSGTAVQGRITNVSVSGAWVLTELQLPPFSRVVVELEDSDYPRTQTVAAYVARESREGLGLEWTEFSPRGIAKLLSRVADTLPGDVERDTNPDSSGRSHFMGGGLVEQRHWR